MKGPTLIVVGAFLLVLGGARSFAARPELRERQTAYGRGDVIGSRILLVGGGLLLVFGVVWSVADALGKAR